MLLGKSIGDISKLVIETWTGPNLNKSRFISGTFYFPRCDRFW